ncbi:MAG: hypothetical protein WBK19_10575 [Azonexus sp.]
MKLIRPSAVTDAILLSSNVPENDFGVWESIYPYAVGQSVIKGHRIWESVQAANLNHDPETSGITWWIDAGPVNRWAMFDGEVGTATVADENITITLQPGRIDSVALLGVDASVVTVTMRLGATVIYQKVTSMIDDSGITDWFDWFFNPIEAKDYAVMTDIPVFGEATLEIIISKPVGQVSCGMCIIGLKSELGGTMRGTSLGINDYSKKTVNDFGNATLVQRSFSKRMGVKLILPNGDVDRVHAVLSAHRAMPVVWIGSDRYSSTLIYGFYRDFEVDVAYAYDSYCTINIEGMI